MKKTFVVLGCAFAMAFGVARAEVTSFPGCAWSEVKVSSETQRVTVTDAKGRLLLSFHGEPRGTSLAKLVVSQAVDRLVVDPRGAFADGMSKLVFTSGDFNPAPFAGRDASLASELGGARGTKGLVYFEGQTKGKRHYYNHKEHCNIRHCVRDVPC